MTLEKIDHHTSVVLITDCIYFRQRHFVVKNCALWKLFHTGWADTFMHLQPAQIYKRRFKYSVRVCVMMWHRLCFLATLASSEVACSQDATCMLQTGSGDSKNTTAAKFSVDSCAAATVRKYCQDGPKG